MYQPFLVDVELASGGAEIDEILDSVLRPTPRRIVSDQIS